MREILDTPLFSVVLCIFCYWVGVFLNRKTRSTLVNPLLVAIVLAIFLLHLLKIPLVVFHGGGSVITMLLGPATAALAIPMYHQRVQIRQNLLPILVGCFVGASTSIVSVLLLCKLFGFPADLTASMIPKSTTTPIAMEISSFLGGLPSVAVAAVVVTGITGAVLAPLMIKIFRVKSEVAQGLGIGCCSHSLGTSKAVEMGQTQGAMSGIAIGVAGLISVFLAFLL